MSARTIVEVTYSRKDVEISGLVYYILVDPDYSFEKLSMEVRLWGAEFYSMLAASSSLQTLSTCLGLFVEHGNPQSRQVMKVPLPETLLLVSPKAEFKKCNINNHN